MEKAEAFLWAGEGKAPYAPPVLEVLMEDMAEMFFDESCCKTKTVFFYMSVTTQCDSRLYGSLSLYKLYGSCAHVPHPDGEIL